MARDSKIYMEFKPGSVFQDYIQHIANTSIDLSYVESGKLVRDSRGDNSDPSSSLKLAPFVV